MRDPLSSVAPLADAGALRQPRRRPRLSSSSTTSTSSTATATTARIGARATQKLGPVRLGGTVVNEFRAGGNYTLLGGDVQIDLKKYGVIIGEYAHSYGALTSFSRSDDGGLTYTDALGTSQATPTMRQGNAYKAEADLHLGPVGLHPYFRGIDQGYTDTAHAQDAGFMQWGARRRRALLRRRRCACTTTSGAISRRSSTTRPARRSRRCRRRGATSAASWRAPSASSASSSACAPSAPTTPTTRAPDIAPRSARASTCASCPS